MDETAQDLNNRPAWIDISSSDAAATRDFYGQLFGWEIEVSDDPQYGGYATAKLGEHSVAGIGPKMDPNAPTAWNLYIGSTDPQRLAQAIRDAGGRVVMEPFAVGDQGMMAVFQDPTGAFISAWKPAEMSSFAINRTGAFGWGELNARGVDNVLPFYENVFGWSVRRGEGTTVQPPYNEFLIDGDSILGAWEMSAMVPAEVPSYWQIYFNVDDVDASFARATELGATEMVAPQDMPGGRFAILMDPQGASFGLLRMDEPGS